MSNKKPNLVCITGADGTGKSTLISQLRNQYENAAVAEIWDALYGDDASLFSNKPAIDQYLCSLTPPSRTLFLAHALKYSIDNALEKDPAIIIINSYYYKYFAAELALGAEHELIASLVHLLPRPDHTILLELPVELAASRKKKFSRYECGLAKSAATSTFIAFQKKVLPKWAVFNQQNWVRISTDAPPESILLQVKKILPPL